MTHALKAEITKFTSLRSTWVYIILMLGSIIGVTTLMVFIPTDTPLNVTWADLMTAHSIFILVTLIFAASTVVGDIDHRMVAHSFLTQRNRHLWLVAKLIVIVAIVELCFWGAVGVSYLIAQVGPVTWEGGDMYNVWTVAWTLPVYTLMSAGLGVVARNKLAASGGLIALFLVIEPLVALATSKAEWISNVYKALPGARLNDLMNWHSSLSHGVDPTQIPNIASPAVAVTVILTWGAVLLLGGLLTNQVRDVK